MQVQYSRQDTLVLAHVNEDGFTIVLYLALVCLFWYCLVVLVSTIGVIQMLVHDQTFNGPRARASSQHTDHPSRWRFYSTQPKEVVEWDSNAPHINIIRPIKGIEPYLQECLTAIFHLHYPRDKLHIRFCVSSRNEPCFDTLEHIVREFPGFDVTILIEEEDPRLIKSIGEIGPNPKIRNMSRAYREAIGDIIWILDCNVWVSKLSLGRMLAKLEGRGGSRKNKLVHQLPLVIDTSYTRDEFTQRDWQSRLGGRLDEAFMSSAHAKFYTAINTILIAPCIVGKSTMFRRSHLDALSGGLGIDRFAHNICEDHLLGDLLWKGIVPEEKAGRSIGKHALCLGDLAVQPIADMSLREYWDRRVRWLRVRKFTVTMATLVEPGTECFLCSVYGSFAMTTLPFFTQTLGIPPTWLVFVLLWLLSVTIWCLCDWVLYCKLQSGSSIENNDETPAFAMRLASGARRRSFQEWQFAWFGREALALPIWIWAVYGGTTVEWRGRRFKVGTDMRVHELQDRK